MNENVICSDELILDVVNLSFDIYKPKDLRNMKVASIKCTSESLDALGTPISGGLNDPALGPIAETELCQTCNQSYSLCPGHLGILKLPALIVNPIFLRTVLELLSCMCFGCYQFRAPAHIKVNFTYRQKALDNGSESLSIEIDNVVARVYKNVLKNDRKMKQKQRRILVLQELLKCLKKELIALDGNYEKRPRKGMQPLEVALHKEFVLECKKQKCCPECNMSAKPVIFMGGNYLIIDKTHLQNEDEAARGEEQMDEEEDMDQTITRDTEEQEKKSGKSYIHMHRGEVRNNFRKLFINESSILEKLYPILDRQDMAHPTDIFFLTHLPVPPPKTRPPLASDFMIVENAQTLVYQNILKACRPLEVLNRVVNDKPLQEDEQAVVNYLQGKTLNEKLSYCTNYLQMEVLKLYDSNVMFNMRKPGNVLQSKGLKQLLEKKEGLFRQNMMGKRVNFAARSVITPDPYLNINEIGIPFCFATALSFPERVTTQNLNKLRKMVINGSQVYPGAVSVQLRPGEEKVLSRLPVKARVALAEKLEQHLTTNPQRFVPVVRRHVLNGDPMLVNRQPTLHRPSIMSHRARVLPKDRTFRLHYANCKAYNADFDGDEMNVHYPQSEMARSEATCLADVCHNYLVPKDGSPLSGLIQDHVVAGIKLAVRGRFFNLDDYQRLLSITTWSNTKRVKLLPPTIRKPEVLWSGKQVISTILLNLIPEGKPAISMRSRAKVPHHEWGGEFDSDMGESEVLIREGELLQGVLDKQQYGSSAYGLVHCFYELYGPMIGGKLLSLLSHLFTFFLQTEGFTIGIADVLVTSKSNRQRRKLMRHSQRDGLSEAARAFDLQWNCTSKEEVKKKYELAHLTENKSMFNNLDAIMKQKTNSITSRINRTCVPAGLIKKFPSNNLQLMVQSGAKGSKVNTMQISGLLGQIELEGKRPPLMLSGRSLPSFPPYDLSPRARGFIDGRFLTGIRPQEFFFHCMAGREGLIDTAVKTSASGYLQRCLVKNLEGLIIGYDMTVRDSDNSVIQFNYGEDGLDVCKDQYLKNSKMLPFLKENGEGILDEQVIDRFSYDQKSVDGVKTEITRLRRKLEGLGCKKRSSAFTKFCEEQLKVHSKEDLGEMWKEPQAKNKEQLAEMWKTEICGIQRVDKELQDAITEGLKDPRTHNSHKQLCKMWNKLPNKQKTRNKDVLPDPVISSFPQHLTMGAVSERLEDALEEYIQSLGKASDDEKQDVRTLIYQKALQSMVTPGDAVGILAAQSIGEPSTQMTLNTFHFAGRGEMNVTLGIPRLRELLMVASKNVKTPTMEIPLREGLKKPQREATRVKEKLTKITLADLLEDIAVREQHQRRGKSKGSRYILRFTLSPEKEFGVKNIDTLRFLEGKTDGSYKKFFEFLVKSIMKKPDKGPTLHVSKSKSSKMPTEKDDDEDEDDKASEDEEDDDKEIDYEDDDQMTNDVEGDDAVDEEKQEEEMAVEEGKKPKKTVPKTIRVEDVLKQNDHIESYTYDEQRNTWCEVTILTKLTNHKPDMTSILKQLASKWVLRFVKDIQRVLVATEAGRTVIRTEGTCFTGLRKYMKILDLSKLQSNDVHFMAEHFGIEAATRTLKMEIKRVFGVYGITVNPRHLSLIADYMTWEGTYRPLNRTGIVSQPSFAQKATFETTSQFILNAIISREKEPLKSPSASLLIGQPCKVGTGTFDILHRLY